MIYFFNFAVLWRKAQKLQTIKMFSADHSSNIAKN